MPEPTVAVCGFPRCGSSMTMAMLDAGGVLPVEGSGPGSYELRSLAGLPDFSTEFLAGRSIKLLDAVCWIPAETWPPMAWRFIWLDRDHVEQARSMVRFFGPAGLNALPLSEAEIPELALSFRRDRPAALKTLRSLGRLLIVSYADVLRDPAKQARRMATFLAPTFDLDADAAAAVVRERGPAALAVPAELEADRA